MTTQPKRAHNRLEDMPISLFATVMGLAGLTIATQKQSTCGAGMIR